MSLRTAMQRSLGFTARRFASTTAPKNTLLPNQYNYSFRQAWLSDPSTYPIITILSLAGAFIVGMSVNAMRYKNVNIGPSTKGEIIPTHKAAYAPNKTVTEVVARRPIGPHAAGYKSLQYEGLGVDHDEWKKNQEKFKQ